MENLAGITDPLTGGVWSQYQGSSMRPRGGFPGIRGRIQAAITEGLKALIACDDH